MWDEYLLGIIKQHTFVYLYEKISFPIMELNSRYTVMSIKSLKNALILVKPLYNYQEISCGGVFLTFYLGAANKCACITKYV